LDPSDAYVKQSTILIEVLVVDRPRLGGAFCLFVFAALNPRGSREVFRSALFEDYRPSVFIGGRSAMAKKAKTVIPWHTLPKYLGLRRSQLQELADQDLLHPFLMNPFGRKKVVYEEEVVNRRLG
jgi:hypothetical protein